MILNSQTADLIRLNAARLVDAIKSKDELTDLITASTFEQVFNAIESLLIHTNMFFDEEILCDLDENSWQTFKALLVVYTLNGANKKFGKVTAKSFVDNNPHDHASPQIL